MVARRSKKVATRTLLHVGCGRKGKDRTTAGFKTSDWTEIRFDIDPAVKPDVVGDIRDMSAISSASIDAVYSSHNLEHLYAHEVGLALHEFHRVLKPEGFAVITCPDLESVCALVAEGKLLEPVYQSAAGPIAPFDILYGHRPSMAEGNLYMAHHSGFTQKVLAATVRSAGFSSVIVKRRRARFFDLWAVATVASIGQEELKHLASLHFPG
jgi:predicted SAM-dependent methyltransferase